jgi:hypothetical protein
MNIWLPVAVVLIVISSQLSLGAGEVIVENCSSRGATASAAPPDFLFATAQEWRRFALEAELDKSR